MLDSGPSPLALLARTVMPRPRVGVFRHQPWAWNLNAVQLRTLLTLFEHERSPAFGILGRFEILNFDLRLFAFGTGR
jgi:hypothetical protein